MWPKSWRNIEDPIVPLERNLYGHPLAGLLLERQFEKVLLGIGFEKIQSWNVFLYIASKVSSYPYTWTTSNWQGRDRICSLCGKMRNVVDLTSPTTFLDQVYLGCTQRERIPNTDIIDEYRKMFQSRISAGSTEKLTIFVEESGKVTAWSYVMAGHAQKCVERLCELAIKNIEQLHKVPTPCLDDDQLKEAELETVGELSKVCARIVLKFLHLARIGTPDILWSVNKLARAVTQWTRACDRRLARLISYIHNASDFR